MGAAGSSWMPIDCMGREKPPRDADAQEPKKKSEPMFHLFPDPD